MGIARHRFSPGQAIGALAVAAALAGAGGVGMAYSRALSKAEQRVSGVSDVTSTRFGDLEYAIAGEGFPLLIVHGTGGGFDQGLAMAESIMQRGHRIIAPSRFGYLRSTFPAAPSAENQADAFVELLDHLGIDKIAVAGGSAGALSAAQFALRHPDRCSGLILLVPAANVRGQDPVHMSRLQKVLVERLLTSDFLFWVALNTARDWLVGTLLATDPQLLAQADPAERARAYRILNQIMPVSARARGMLNDARLAGNPARMDFSRVAVPALIISVDDDRFGTAATARDIARVVLDARLVIYPGGGHIWIGHDDALSDEVSRFISQLPAG